MHGEVTHHVGNAEGGMWSFAEVCSQGDLHKAVSWNPRHLERGLGDRQSESPGIYCVPSLLSFSSSALSFTEAELPVPSYLLIGKEYSGW